MEGLSKNFKFIEGDLRDFELCRKLTKGVDMICHQAALPSVPRSVRDPIASNEHNVVVTLNLLRAAVENGVSRVVYASSSSAYGNTPTLPKVETMAPNPISPYAVSKLAGEYYMRAFNSTYGIDTVSLRYFNVFGPHQNPNSEYAAVIPKFIYAALGKDHITIYGDGKTSRDFTFIDNVVDANMRALTNKNNLNGDVINIACGKSTTLLDLASTVENLIGRSVEISFDAERSGDVKHSLADISKAKRLLGYKPEVNFKQGLKGAFKYYKREFSGSSR